MLRLAATVGREMEHDTDRKLTIQDITANLGIGPV
jgi:hypothetical protein